MSLENIIIIFALIVPIIIFSAIILYYDKTKEEPLGKIILGIIFGAITLILSIIYYKEITIFSAYPNIDYIKIITNVISIIIVGFVIEVTRFLLFYILAVKNKDFDELNDGIVYALCMMFSFVVFGLLLYIVFVKGNIVHLINLFTVVPTQIFTAIIMGYYISMAVFTRNKERKRKKLMKALFVTAFINCFMYALLINQYYLYAYSITMYYMLTVFAFIIEILTAYIAIKYLIRIHKLDGIYENGHKYPATYDHLMTKMEFALLEKRNKIFLERDLKKNIYLIVMIIMSILIVSFIGIIIYGKVHLTNSKGDYNVHIGKDTIPKVQMTYKGAKQVNYTQYVDGDKLVVKIKYKSTVAQIETDKYMNYLLLNGYNFTNEMKNYNETKTFELITSSQDINKLIVIDIKSKDKGYTITIEKKTGNIVRK